MHAHSESEAGFSLIELMIALVVTLVITGAVFGLLSGGQSAFRREPDMTDRQQNIRLGMDVINRDIASAGIGMPPFIQSFTPGLNEVGPAAPGGGRTDELAMLANTSSVEPELLCGYQSGHASHIRAVRNNTLVPTDSVSLVLLDNGGWTIKYVSATHGNNGGPGTCDNSPHDDFEMNPGQDPTGLDIPGGICEAGSVGYNLSGTCNPTSIGAGEFVSYRINPGADGVPNLERRSSGSANTSLSWGDTGNWQVVARGIENMQIQYTQQNGTVSDDAPAVVADNYTTLITKVKVTMTARGTAAKVAGGTTASGGPVAIRGSMTSESAIRSALQWISAPSPAPSGSPSPLWN